MTPYNSLENEPVKYQTLINLALSTGARMNIYAQSLQSADKQAADMMESIFTTRKIKDIDKKQA